MALAVAVPKPTLEQILVNLLAEIAKATTLIEVNVAAGVALQLLLGVDGG